MTIDFTLDGRAYTALNGGPQFSFTEAVSCQVVCADQDEVDHYWTRLGEGGEEGPCGWLKDQFGFSWQIVPRIWFDLADGSDPERRRRAFQAMLGMSRLDIAEIRRAADASP